MTRNLGNRTGIVELEGKLRLFFAQLELFHTLKTIAGVSWNPAHIVIRFVGKVIGLDKAQRA